MADRPPADPPSTADPGTGIATRFASVGALAFLVIGLGGYALSAALLRWPELLRDVGVLEPAMATYGRLFPAGVDALLYGWLTLGLAAIVIHAVPRLVGARLFLPIGALAVVAVMVAGAGYGVVAILLGDAEGGRFVEMPQVADLALLAGYLGLAVIATATARRGDRAAMPLGAWFLVAAPWMLFLSQAAASIPGLDGIPGEIQGAFVGTAMTGTWVALAAAGAGYFVLSRLMPDAEFHPHLGRIGFWSVLVTWPWTTGRAFQAGPVGEWIGTVPVLFGAGVVLATIAIVTDWGFAFRTRWSSLKGSPPLQLAVAGAVFFVAGPIVAFVATLRSVSAVVQFTPWEAGYEQVMLLGAFTLWVMAGLAHVVPASTGRSWRPWMGRVVLWPVVVGVAVSAGSRLVAGLQQGYGWLAGVQSGEYLNVADGFGVTAVRISGANTVQAFGLAVAGVGAVLFVLFTLRYVAAGGRGESDAPASFPTAAPLAAVVRGAVALFVVGAVGAFALPAVDSDKPPTALAEASHSFEPGSVQEQGRELYVAEGCWHCHTQQVRAVVTDVGLGTVSTAGDYAYDPAGTLGVWRIGPDLAAASLREESGSASFVLNHLLDPRATRPWSVMPAYDHLTIDELTALAAYVAGLG